MARKNAKPGGESAGRLKSFTGTLPDQNVVSPRKSFLTSASPGFSAFCALTTTTRSPSAELFRAERRSRAAAMATCTRSNQRWRDDREALMGIDHSRPPAGNEERGGDSGSS